MTEEDEIKQRPCGICPHKAGQHDEDGFCEEEDGKGNFCKCSGYELKMDDHAEASD